jgi:hypothetical protein
MKSRRVVGSRLGALRPQVAALGLALSVLGGTAAFAQRASAQSAVPSAAELTAARELFQSAYQDEQEKRFAQALEKFRRVASVKESASVRYRIGSVLESLGRLREARDAFRALAASKPNLPANEQEIGDSAAERAHQLDTKIPRIVLRLPENAPPDARVTLDGAAVTASTTPRQLELDPGEHLVQATSSSTRPSETRVVLGEGSEVTVNVALGPPTSAISAAPPPTTPPVATAPPDHGPGRDRTLAYVALGGGGALLVTGLVLLGIREGDISAIEKACGSDNVCPSSSRADLEGKRDQAELFGPLGVGLGVVGLAGVGIGSWLLFRPAPSGARAASTTSTSSGLRVTPRPLLGGGMVGLSSVF